METNLSVKNDYIGGLVSIGLGAYCGSKAITSGIRRILGVRIEEHTTSLKNAEKIIKSGQILDPKYGGSGCAKIIPQFVENSDRFVHITGFHKDFSKTILNDTTKEVIEMFVPDKTKRDKIKKVYDIVVETPLLNPVRAIYRKVQKLMYRGASNIDENFKNTAIDCLSGNKIKVKEFKKGVIDNILNIVTGKNSKTFYIGGTDKYFNDNFIPDSNDFALKSDKAIKVCKTKIGAAIDSIKRDGLSGIKQNKSRVIVGATITACLGYLTYKLVKNGLEKIGIIKNKECNQKMN